MAVISRPKQVIRDYCRRRGLSGPLYFLVEERKVDIHKYYTVQLSIDDEYYEGVGLSRRLAEFKAALNAFYSIRQNDPTIMDYNCKKVKKYGRSINRSLSVDYITNPKRSGSFSSFKSDTAGQFSPSSTTSIDGIDSTTEKSDCSTNNQTNTIGGDRKRGDLETSSDEGVDLESSGSSSSAVPSPKLSMKEQPPLFELEEQANSTRSHSKSRFTQFLLNPFRTLGGQSNRKSSTNMVKTMKNSMIEDASRPNSSSSASSTSSAFSSSSSISSSTNGNHGDHLETIEKLPLSNNLKPDLIDQPIMEEDENDNDGDCDNSDNSKKEIISRGNDTLENNPKVMKSFTLPYNGRAYPSFSSSLFNGGPLSTNQKDSNEFCLTLLRYCVRMYLPYPWYELHYEQNTFQANCRVVMLDTNETKPITIPDKYLNKNFVAKGEGEDCRKARNMAAKMIISKLKEAGIYYE